MPIYTHNGNFGPPVNIGTFIHNAAANPNGPLPLINPPAAAVTNLATGQTGVQNTNLIPWTTRAWGLISCAAVIYMSTDAVALAAAWVHHANVGNITIADINTAQANLAAAPAALPPFASMLVIFAHPNNTDPGYAAPIQTMVNQGIPANRIVEIPNLIVPAFGINNLGQIG